MAVTVRSCSAHIFLSAVHHRFQPPSHLAIVMIKEDGEEVLLCTVSFCVCSFDDVQSLHFSLEEHRA